MTTYIGMKAWDMGFDAHITIQYTGELDAEEEDFMRYILDSFTNGYSLITYAKRLNIEMFGSNKNLPVLTIEPPSILVDLNKYLEHHRPSPSEFPWNPHITLNLDVPGPIHLPEVIKLTDLDFY